MRANHLFLLLALLTASPAFGASDCSAWEASLAALKRSSQDPDLRSWKGQCLIKNHLGKEAVARGVLKIIRDAKEDLLLREDLITALGETPLRKRLKVDESPAPEVDSQDLTAMDRTVASAQSILALTQAIESMDEIVPVTPLEQEFFRALSEVAGDRKSPVLLRAAAVSSLEAATKRVAASGVYDPKSIRLAEDTLKSLADGNDNGSYYSGAGPAYGRLAGSGVPFFVVPAEKGRMIASEKSQ